MGESSKSFEKISNYRDLEIISRNEKDIEIVIGGDHNKEKKN
jgi:hypothetical protein